MVFFGHTALRIDGEACSDLDALNGFEIEREGETRPPTGLFCEPRPCSRTGPRLPFLILSFLGTVVVMRGR